MTDVHETETESLRFLMNKHRTRYVDAQRRVVNVRVCGGLRYAVPECGARVKATNPTRTRFHCLVLWLAIIMFRWTAVSGSAAAPEHPECDGEVRWW